MSIEQTPKCIDNGKEGTFGGQMFSLAWVWSYMDMMNPIMDMVSLKGFKQANQADYWVYVSGAWEQK